MLKHEAANQPTLLLPTHMHTHTYTHTNAPQHTHTHTYTLTHTHTHTHTNTPPTHTLTHTLTHPHLLQMPISAEQWRTAVGAINASRRPCQTKRMLPCWEIFLCLLAALLVSTLLPGGGGGSRSEYWNMPQMCWNSVTAILHGIGIVV